jgi:hypothetical protein
MEFALYIELASRVIDFRLLDLVRFPVDHAFGASEWSAHWWAHGKTKRMRSEEREKVLQKIAVTGLNELELKWHPVEPALLHGAKVLSAQLQFYPSPMSDLWSAVPMEDLKVRADDRSRKNFLNVESVLRANHRLPYPSTLECYLKLSVSGKELSDAQLQEISIRWVRSAIPDGLAAQAIFGYGCVHGTCRRRLMVMSLGLPEIDDLGPKFENVYPILFGPRASCEGLAAALAGRGKVVPISNESPSEILSINPDDVKTASQDPAVKEWLVGHPPPRDLLGPRVYVVPPKKE